jgi:PBP1b-binding outer membrane lipoprotein LpoB
VKKISSIITAIVFLSGCASNVTTGERVFITPSDSAHLSNCEILGQVQVDATIALLWDRNQQSMEIKNRLRDAASQMYPNADTVTHSDLNVGAWSAPDAQAMGTVFKCFKPS